MCAGRHCRRPRSGVPAGKLPDGGAIVEADTVDDLHNVLTIGERADRDGLRTDETGVGAERIR
jgi:hypothetical protein